VKVGLIGTKGFGGDHFLDRHHTVTQMIVSLLGSVLVSQI